MATRRSRMKVLPNLGGRGNKETKPVTNSTGKDVKKDDHEGSKAVTEPCASSGSMPAKVENVASIFENQDTVQLTSVLEIKTNRSIPENIENIHTVDKVSESESKKNAASSKEDAADDREDISAQNESSKKLETKNTSQDDAISTQVTESLSLTSEPAPPARSRVRLPKATPNLGSSRRGLGISRPEDDRIPVRRPPPVQRLASLPDVPTKPPASTQCPMPPSEPLIKRPPPVQRVAALQEQTTNVPSTDGKGDRCVLPDDDNLVAIAESAKNTSISITGEIASPPPPQPVVPGTKHPTQEVVANKVKTAAPPLTSNSKPGRATERRHSYRGADRDEFAPKKKRTMKKVPPPERSKMTMQDLIYYNPTTNPMKYPDEADPEDGNEVILNTLDDDDDEPTPTPRDNGTEDDPTEDRENEEDDAMPMPQVKIGPDGNIIIDEKSLVIETTASKKNVESGDIVYEKSSNTTYSSYRKRRRAKVWSDRETTKFYRVLNSVGADFSMMTNFFPNRSRYELKLKFNREDRFNRGLIDKAINDCHHFDISLLQEDFDSDDLSSETGSVAGSKRGKSTQQEVEEEDQENVDNNKTSTRGRKQRGRGSGRGRGAGKRRIPRRMSVYASDGSSEEEDEPHVEVADLQPASPTDKQNDVESDERNPLTFDLDNPLNENSAKTQNLCSKPIVIDDESDNTVDDGSMGAGEDEDEEQDDEIQVLLSTPAPTRAGRQPKRPQLFATTDDDVNTAKKRRKPVTSTSAPRASPVVTNNPASILSRLALSPTAAESRLVFVPTRTPDQMIHVYMLSPVNTSPTGATNLASGNTTPVSSPLLTRPAGIRSPGGVTTPVSTPMCYAVGSSPIVISPVHYPGMRSPPQALRITQKNFVPNLNAAGRRGRGRPPKTSILARALSSPPLFNQAAIGVRLASVNPSSTKPPVSSPACPTTTLATSTSPALSTTPLPPVVHTDTTNNYSLGTDASSASNAVTFPPLVDTGVKLTPVENRSSTVIANTNQISGAITLPSVIRTKTAHTFTENASSPSVMAAGSIARTITLPSVTHTGVAHAPLERTASTITSTSLASRTITLPSIECTEASRTPGENRFPPSISEHSVTNQLSNNTSNITTSVTSLLCMESICISDSGGSPKMDVSVESAAHVPPTQSPAVHSLIGSNPKVCTVGAQTSLNETTVPDVCSADVLQDINLGLQTTAMAATEVTEQPPLITNTPDAKGASLLEKSSPEAISLPLDSR